MRNRYKGECACGRTVPANQGDVTKRGGVWIVHCRNHDADGRRVAIINGNFAKVPDPKPEPEEERKAA